MTAEKADEELFSHLCLSYWFEIAFFHNI